METVEEEGQIQHGEQENMILNMLMRIFIGHTDKYENGLL